MAVIEQRRVVNAARYAAGLTRAIRSVVRVMIGGGESTVRCTGWMLTPSIAVVPSYVLTPREPLKVEGIVNGRVKWSESTQGEAEQLGGDRFRQVGGQGQSAAIALVSLARPHRVPMLELRDGEMTPEEMISVLSFSRGESRLYLSPGTVLSSVSPFVSYDADTDAGSGGAPVFDSEWCVAGVHMFFDSTSRVNSGVNQSSLLEMLRESQYWKTIAKVHGLADVSSAERALERGMALTDDARESTFLRAALRINFSPARLTSVDRMVLQDKVLDPRAKRWTLQPAVRRQVLASYTGGIEGLRPFAPRLCMSIGDRVIKRILQGRPYNLADQDENSLAWWIQAAGWFSGVVEGLPTPENVKIELERRRTRSRLRSIASPDFAGRKSELRKLDRWFKGKRPRAISVTGIGGVGKSALVARFASKLPKETLLLWLDFDRADLAPDDAVSVLKAIGQQASAQLDGFVAPSVSEKTWRVDARKLARKLAKHTHKFPPLLVMDSFEAAQYVERYQELWPVLDLLRLDLPALRVIVSGRAPVKPLKGIVVSMLSAPDARKWLQRHGIRRASVIERVLDITGRIPLNLHLAKRVLETGGRINVRKRLPPELVTGFLYGRILDRLQSEELKPVSEAALVLRRVTPELAAEVLGGQVKLPEGPPSAWFGELARECALVEGSDVLKLRPEVRTAALKLLEHVNPKLVRNLDERAEEWYAKLKPSMPEIAAELVYHRLRLGDVKGASKAWVDGCAAFLQYEETNLKGIARRWLSERKGAVAVSRTHVKLWEQEASERIREARRRGHSRVTAGVLAERRDRSRNSSLFFHESYNLRAAGKRVEALKHLDGAGLGQGSVQRDRAALRGLLLAELGRKYEADVVLKTVEEAFSYDSTPSAIESLLAVAGRLRVATDLDAEEEMIGRLGTSRHEFFLEWVSPIDIVLPGLAQHFEGTAARYTLNVKVPRPGASREAFARAIERFRSRSVINEPPQLEQQRRRVIEGLEVERSQMTQLIPEQLIRVLECGWRRWTIAANSDGFSRLVEGDYTPDGVDAERALRSSVALFLGFNGLSLEVLDGPLDRVFRVGLKETLRSTAADIFRAGPDPLVVLVDRLAGKETGQ